MNRLLLAGLFSAAAIMGRGMDPKTFVENIAYRHTIATGVWGGFRATYDKRLAANPNDYEARILKAATYLGEATENPDVDKLVRSYGGLLDRKTMTCLGALSFAGAPPSNSAVDSAAAVAIPALDAAEGELAQIPADWNGSFDISPKDYPVDELVRFDRGDLLVLKALLSVARAKVLYAQGLDLAVDNAKCEAARKVRELDCAELGFTPAMDGSLGEWSGVAETFVDEDGFVAQCKAGSHAGRVYLSFRMANSARLSWSDVHFTAVNPATGARAYSGCVDVPEGDGKIEGRSDDGWPCSVVRKGDVVEIGVKVPESFPAQHTRVRIYAETANHVSFKDDRSRRITVDGRLSDWNGLPVYGGDDDTLTARVHRNGREISLAFENEDSLSGNALDYFYMDLKSEDYELKIYGWEWDGEQQFEVEVLECIREGVWCDFHNTEHTYKYYLELDYDCCGCVAKASGRTGEVKIVLPEWLEDLLVGEEFEVERVYGDFSGTWDGFYWDPNDWKSSSIKRRQPSARELMEDHPDFLRNVRSFPKLNASKTSLRAAFGLLQDADAVLARRSNRTFHFFDYDPALSLEQAKVREWVATAKASIDAPQTHDLHADFAWLRGRGYLSAESYRQACDSLYSPGTETFSLGTLFTGALNRSKLPYITCTDIPVLSSLPDATFGGLGSSMSLSRILNVAEGRAEFARIFTGSAWPGTVSKTAEAPVWMVRYVVGSGNVTYRSNLSKAIHAKLLCYVDGVLQPTTVYSGEDLTRTIGLGAYGEHEIAWCFESDGVQVYDVCPVQDIRGSIVDSSAWQNVGRASLFDAEDATEFAGDAVYNGWLRDAGGAIVGLLEIKASRAVNGRPSKVSGTITWLSTGKKEEIPAEQIAPGANVSYQGISLGGLSLGGSYQGYSVSGARDRTRSKDKEEKSRSNAELAAKAGVRTFALMTDVGFATFTATVDKKGKCKFAGTLPDGTKVSVSGKGVLGANGLAIPLVFRRKASVGLVFWAYDDGAAEISDEAAVVLASGASYMPATVAPASAHSLQDGEHVFVTEDGVEQAFGVAGRKWTFPKKDGNPIQLKMTFADRTGAVKGSYAIPEGKKKIRHTVFGVVVDDVMLGSTYIKNVGSCAVWSE